jgi:hypothetical protein
MVVLACIFRWVSHHLTSVNKEANLLWATSPILHWLMDILVVEPIALMLYRYGNYPFSLGLDDKLTVLSWVLSCTLCIVLAGAAHQTSKKRCGADIATACGLLACSQYL